MVANGDLTFKKITKENVDKIRNQLSNHTLRSDDQHNGQETSSPSKLEE